mgnify:CR=1 FL=1
MTKNDNEFGPPDGPRRVHAGTGTSAHAGHAPDHSSGQQGEDHGGHGGHKGMMMACCVPLLVIAVGLGASGTHGAGQVVLAMGRTRRMARVTVGV